MFVPSLLLRRLYTFGSLKNTDGGVAFSIKNRLSDAEFTGLRSVRVGGRDVPLDRVRIRHGGGELRGADLADRPLAFPLRATLDVFAAIDALPAGKHPVEIVFDSRPFGKLKLEVEDAIGTAGPRRVVVPRDGADDYAEPALARRRAFVEEFTGTSPRHIYGQSFDPHLARGNCELFTGVAQVPLGVAGPITVHGEHARGDFLVPMATSEGTLVASYNRGIQVVNLSGGVKCTVVGDVMQRAPVLVFDDARGGRDFVRWVAGNMPRIRQEAEATSSVAKLSDVDPYLANKFVYLRFNYTTGDAAGQNMVGRATFAACSWILDHYPGVRHFYLESNFATDKKASQVNIMRTRGKRVTAEATIRRGVLVERMRVEPEQAGVVLAGELSLGAAISSSDWVSSHERYGRNR